MIDYGVPNKERSPTIAPFDGPKNESERREWEARGDATPDRPAWLCILAPEHSSKMTSTAYDWTPEQIEAQKKRHRIAYKNKKTREVKEKREQTKRAAASEKRKKYEAKLRAERSQKNKGKKFKSKQNYGIL